MSLNTSLVDIVSIKPNASRSQFSESDLEEVAKAMVELGGILKPLILRRTGISSFEVIVGDFEYYVAVKASEIDDDIEMVRAFIIEPEQEEIVQRQLAAGEPKQVLRETPSSEIATGFTPGVDSRITNMESRQTNLESRLDAALNSLKQEQATFMQQLEDKIEDVERQIPPQGSILDAFNQLSESDLAFRLQTAGVKGKTGGTIIKNIVKARHEKPFESLSDVVARVKGLSDKRMLAIVDTWSRVLFK
ncbi:ParB N-terminal domain-containing protein [Phormidium sp. CCY1219]|uniref:ParB N-terminal domain-containing protein n=1 Tax=Phormidium sp. CCY1219 TaxID=2886104 RepID=UPI002D1E4DC1|nr:hypothetical protein [Phormidium sp. CCY1219]MEB3827951.1 hypothetical protein [Phormidium sp. CCY1219]